jgi:predicted acylesterase/phospholipase RssA
MPEVTLNPGAASVTPGAATATAGAGTAAPGQPTFYLGLCMAGAVSAGSYTAGVIDYLLEALEEWEKRRGGANVPSHRVEIPVIGGASAGGMTGIITAAALQQGNVHLQQAPADALSKDHPENVLYHTWVDLTGPDMFPKMLDTSDVIPGQVVSALNSTFIDEIATRVLTPPAGNQTQWRSVPEFFSSRLKIFTTLSNLQGFLYDVNFKAANDHQRRPYYMQIHNDYACFELTEDLTVTDDSKPCSGWLPFSVSKQVHADVARDAAMATGAFPVGLKSRTVTRDARFVNANPLQSEGKQLELAGAGPYVTLNVDGGMINNEPFDKVREVLNRVSKVDDPKVYQDYNQFNSTVLMVAPFPSSKPGEILKDQGLFNVVGLTLSAMLSQMRSKPAHLVDAMDDDCAGQYLIAPSRRVPDGKGGEVNFQGERAIACGALGGFSGFMNKEFRVHDYFLGRYNCQVFLRDYFTVPAKALEVNPVFQQGYNGVDRALFKSTVDDSYQIIPVFFPAGQPVFPSFQFTSGTNWPVQDWKQFSRFEGPIRDRVQAVLLNTRKLSAMNRTLLWAGSKLLLRRLISGAVLDTIKKELSAWQLVKNP